MIIFEDIQDVEDWLEPLDYLGLWQAVAPYGVFADADRAHCDVLIANGEVPQATILEGLKVLARVAMTERFGLEHRIYAPVDAQYLKTTH